MPMACYVKGCKSKNRMPKPGISYFRIPAIIRHQGEQVQEMTTARRQKWLRVCELKDNKYTRICSKHFISGKPSALFDTTNPDWAPMANSKASLRYERTLNRNRKKNKLYPPPPTTTTDQDFADHTYAMEEPPPPKCASAPANYAKKKDERSPPPTCAAAQNRAQKRTERSPHPNVCVSAQNYAEIKVEGGPGSMSVFATNYAEKKAERSPCSARASAPIHAKENTVQEVDLGRRLTSMALSDQSGKAPSTSGNSNPSGKIIIQQCLSARLQVKPATDDEKAEYIEIDRGIVVYVCFLKGATKATVEKMVKTVLTIRLSENDNNKRVSVIDLPGDVLIVPQATLGGKPKGKMMQYHSNIAKDEGFELYTSFCDMCHAVLNGNEPSLEVGSKVKHGTYGNRQVLAVLTNGPYTHIFDF